MRFYYFLVANLLVFNLLNTSTVFSQCNATLSGNQNYSAFGGGCTTTPNGVTINSIGTGETLTFNVSITITGNMILNFVSAGSHIVINSGVTVTVNGDLNFNGNNGAKTITVNGTLDIKQNFNAHNNVTYNGNGVVKVASNWQNNGSGADCPSPCNLKFTVNNCLQFNDPICVDTRNNPFLPVSLLYFKGQNFDNHYIDFEWQTATEINNAFFILEGSTDGQNFRDFAQIEGNGNSIETKTYHYRWHIQNFQWSYFRLKQVDLDGTESVFRVIYISSVYSKIKISPLFYKHQAYKLEIPPYLSGVWTLFSISGQIIEQKIFESDNKPQEFILNLPSGHSQLYLLKIQHQRGTLTFKLF